MVCGPSPSDSSQVNVPLETTATVPLQVTLATPDSASLTVPLTGEGRRRARHASGWGGNVDARWGLVEVDAHIQGTTVPGAIGRRAADHLRGAFSRQRSLAP